MTALLKRTNSTLNLGRRGQGEVWTPRPCGGEHKELVRAALKDTVRKHDKTLRELAKV
jgi:hypothetical protein